MTIYLATLTYLPGYIAIIKANCGVVHACVSIPLAGIINPSLPCIMRVHVVLFVRACMHACVWFVRGWLDGIYVVDGIPICELFFAVPLRYGWGIDSIIQVS